MRIPSLVRAEEREQFFRKHSPELNQMAENVDATGFSNEHARPRTAGQERYRPSSPVTVRLISIRWNSDAPSKMVKILEDMGRVIAIPAPPPIGP
jgi:hypothetical protein